MGFIEPKKYDAWLSTKTGRIGMQWEKMCVNLIPILDPFCRASTHWIQ